MKKQHRMINRSVLSGTIAAVLACAPAFQVMASDNHRVIVTMPTVTSQNARASTEQMFRKNVTTLANSINADVLNTLPSVNAVVLDLTLEQQQALIASGAAVNIEEDPKRFLMAETSPYGIAMTQANLVSDSLSGNRKVCIMDTGYTLGHEDLPNAGITGNDGYGSNDTGNWYHDGNGHGTHVAGTIAAIGGNSKGVVGVNPSGQLGLHIVKVFNDQGNWAYGSDLIKAIEQCEAAGANVTSMSLGGSGSSTAERQAFEQSYARGMLHIAAAGNSGNSSLSYPASYDAVVSVAAVDSNENKASFSQYNNQVEIAGPGVGVNSTWNDGGYKSISGTSMATPHVSGVAALVWSQFPECSNQQIRNALNASAKDKGVAGRDTSYGYGIVQAKAAVDYLARNKCGDVQDPVVSDFTYSVQGLSVSFNNKSANATSYSWTFGDGQQSTQANPSHTYATSGNYTVTLTASSSEGSAKKSMVVTIKDGGDTGGCIGISPWDANKTYRIGDRISYNNFEYESIWWSRGAQPDIFSNVWKKGSKCN
ncbi:S8 family serine peptidase [Pseudoalteromonas xiamenensis]|uniref:S8 family serine peptidase n=1 Tax=Pseudoalteromonas xiamenensis TaxID=882626 RepID=A0A975HPB6_9GAMM|nr:S8 family serine peptidase [Pseudoalteromonas xiamenensis]QTH73090.1 S8 family serine peptidase [Pseudoalteromonas xiamenensis]